MQARVRKRDSFNAELSLPGDKSISHRALIMASLAKGTSRVTNFLPSQDCLSTMDCLMSLGVEMRAEREDVVIVEGKGPEGMTEPENVLDAGNSGTTIRLLSGILSGLPFFSCISGDESLRSRPMRRVVEPLSLMGANIWGRHEGKFAPLAILGGCLSAIEYAMPVASAQVKSAILLAGLHAQGKTVVREPAPTRDHTERMLWSMGAKMEVAPGVVSIHGGQTLKACDFPIPGDLSSAAYLLAISAILPDSSVLIRQVGVNATRRGFLDLLARMGAKVEVRGERMNSFSEPVADLALSTSQLQGIEVKGDIIPRVIDELPLLAVVATQARGETVVRDAQELRVKESDRIGAIVGVLSRMGADIEERADGFIIRGPCRLKGAVCESLRDHRIAMSAAVAGMIAEGETMVLDAESVEVSFPNFWQVIGLAEEDLR